MARSLLVPAVAASLGLLLLLGAFGGPSGYVDRGWYLIGPYLVFASALYNAVRMTASAALPAVRVASGFVEVHPFPRTALIPATEFCRAEVFDFLGLSVVRLPNGARRKHITLTRGQLAAANLDSAHELLAVVASQRLS